MAAMRLALFEPDIPQNTGAVLRLAAALGVGVDIIEPTGFVWSDRRLRRAGMDYLDQVSLARHRSWDALLAQHSGGLLLLTTQGTAPYTEYAFAPSDTLLLGRESAGVPQDVHDRADARLCIPMAPGARSLNVAVAAAMVLGEALRQAGMFSEGGSSQI